MGLPPEQLACGSPFLTILSISEPSRTSFSSRVWAMRCRVSRFVSTMERVLA